MSILIEKIRIKNFRSLQNIEVSLKQITILVGANNSGKTTFLRAINSVLGIAKNQINKDDLFVDKNGTNPEQEIVIDIKIVPIDDSGKRVKEFPQEWTSKLGGAGSFLIENEQDSFAFRTIYSFGVEDIPVVRYFLIPNWDSNSIVKNEKDEEEFKKMNLIRNNIKMFFIDAQRDILEDSKQRTSYFGKLVSQLDYGDNLNSIKQQIEALNTNAIEKSEVLKHLKLELEKINKTNQTKGNGVTINPFPKNIRDLHKGMKVYFQDNNSDAFSMEYHGMGTRSWASILTAGAYTAWETKQIEDKIEKGKETDLLFPLFALEEPEAHLHPNAQRTLYHQLRNFKGQKIISTHSPYIAGQAELNELRHFYKDGDKTNVTEIYFDVEDRLKIEELNAEIDANGRTTEIYRKINPQLSKLKEIAASKLSKGDERKIQKEIMLSKGELLFARAIVLFEGPTEEMALPVFAHKYFEKSHFELGLTFVAVSGKNNYSPFLKVAKFLNIPTFILSDGDGNTESEVKSQIKNVFGNENAIDLFVLDNGTDFEKYLVEHGYIDEIIKAINEIKNNDNYLVNKYIPELNGQNNKGGEKRDYTGEVGIRKALLDCMSENKTDFAEEIAEQIVNSTKNVPPRIKELFDKISEKLIFNAVVNE